MLHYYMQKIDDLLALLSKTHVAVEAEWMQNELRDFRRDMSALALAWSPTERARASANRTDDGWARAVRARTDDGWGGGGGAAAPGGSAAR
eukprot:SAG11_NODE_16415_length_548_cov_0.458797_1_plen_91_part_00